MPELKRIFQAGTMNRDLDDRLLPPGQYRAALNVNIGRSEGADVGAIENLLGNELIESNDYIPNGIAIGVYRDNGNERIYFFVTDNDSADESNPETARHAIYEYNQNSRLIRLLLSDNQLNFHSLFRIHGINLVDDLLFWTDNRNEPRKINIDLARNNSNHYVPAEGSEIDDQIAVAKHSPHVAPTILATGSRNVETNEEITSNFMEDKLIRFAYRWKFEDGEYSTISPFSSIAFQSNADDITEEQAVEAVTTNEVRDFVNTIKSVSLSAPIPSGFGITEVDLIYKEVGSTTLYIAENKPAGGLSEESFIYNSQDPFRALPGSQLTRVYDAVPRRARAQEVAGGRIVYGDYLQNYNIPNIDFSVGVTTDGSGAHSRFPRHSVKSRRTYQVGIILADRAGRQTPVILSSSGNDTVFVPNVSGTAEAALQSLSITFANTTEIPSWAYSYRVVVKQRQHEYYNWFSTTTDGGEQTRFGDGVNKIPIDQTALVDQNALTRPSSRSVFVKIPAAVDNNQYRVTAINQTALVEDLVAGTVYETVPDSSLLDIFFETSTGALVSSIGDDRIPIDFFNCYLVNVAGNNVEANRLRMGFNEAAFDIGVRAYQVQENFFEERRFNTLIHSSGLFNSRTGFNQINQFNEAEGGLSISLDPSDGSVQKLYAEDTQLLIFQEDKVSRSPIDKDFIYSAEGGAVPVTSSSQYLGTVAPYAGEYGISNDPGSFAIYGTRKYFTDRNRGVVIRLSNDGLSEISKAGMSDFFRDAFRTSSEIIGSFDEYSDTYNLTIIGTGYASNEDTNVATANDRYFTMSFEEDVNGWSSFKSFKQEGGLTLNNRYYTLGLGKLWQHNSENVPRNTFYENENGTRTIQPSYVDLIFNDAPSLVKQFETLGYEGTEGWECEYIETDLDSFGTVPTAQGATTVTLQIGGSVDNGSVSGEQVFIETPGTTVKWTVVASPVSSLYQFTDIGDVTITSTNTDVTITNPTVIVNGNLVFEIEYTTTLFDEIIPITIAGDADAVFEVSLLVVNVDDQFTNAFVSPGIVRFTEEDKDDTDPDNVVITVTPSPGYILDVPDPTLVIGDHLGAAVISRDGGIMTITIPATIPDDPSLSNVSVTGSTIIELVLSLLANNTVANLNSAVAPTSITMFNAAEENTIDVTVTVVGEFILGADDLSIASNVNGFNFSDISINDDENIGTYSVTYTGDQLTENTVATFNITGTLTDPFITFELAGDPVTLLTTESNEADNILADVLTNTRGVDADVTSDSLWLTAAVAGDQAGIQAAEVAADEAFEFDGGFRTGTLTFTSSDVRFPNLESTLDVRQRGNAYWVVWPVPGGPDGDAEPATELVVNAGAHNFGAGTYAFVAPGGTTPEFVTVGDISTLRASPNGASPFGTGGEDQQGGGLFATANTTGADRELVLMGTTTIGGTLFTIPFTIRQLG